MRWAWAFWVFVAEALLGSAGAFADSRIPTPNDPPPPDYVDAFAESRYADAKAELLKRIAADPTNKFLQYNLACAEAMLGEKDDAVESLLDALSLGFVDFQEMDRDHHLDPIRADPRYKTILEKWALLLDTRADAELEAMRKAFGPEYTFEKDDAKRLTWASAFDDAGFASAKHQVQLVYDWARPLFAEPAPAAARPDPWVRIILPTTPDFLRLVGPGRIGGYYDKDNKLLVSRDIGPSLRHEFFHVLHWRHMARLAQTHPIWLQEGLACLPEDVDENPDGTLTIRPSWRTNIAKRLARFGGLTPWERLFTMDQRTFVDRRPRAAYAESRAVVMFLLEKGKLVEWYRAYVADFENDPTGLASMQRVFGKPSHDIQADFRAWLIQLEEVADIDRPGPGLGVALSQGRGDGPIVDEIVAANPSGIGGQTGNRLRRRDVVVAIDGRTVRTLDDLTRILGEHEVGDDVVVTVRRGTTTRDIPVTLVAPEQ